MAATRHPRLPPEILDLIAGYADDDARLALLYTGWTGYAAAMPHLYHDVKLSMGLGAGLEHKSTVRYPIGRGGHPEEWPNAASHERKRAALACVRRMSVHHRVDDSVPPNLKRLQSIILEPGADMKALLNVSLNKTRLSPLAVCVRLSGSDLHWASRIKKLFVQLVAAYPSEWFSIPTEPISVLTLHGFDLCDPAQHFNFLLEAPVRLWPRPTRSSWTETPWQDNVSDWETFLANMSGGKIELVVPQEPLTCQHADEYAAAAFHLRVLLHMDADAAAGDKDVSTPFGVQCACGQTKQEKWCSEPLLAAIKDEGLEDAELIERMRARDARLPPPPTGPCVSPRAGSC